jgi:carboxyl-terminal processing protease
MYRSWSQGTRRLVAAIAVSVTAAGVLVAGTRSPPVDKGTSLHREMDLMGEVIRQVHENYVDVPDDKKMMAGAISGMLSALDPHSSYMTDKELAAAEEEFVGEFGGLGIEVTIEDGLIKVVSALDDTPAARAGIKTNDVISEIDGDPADDLPLEKAVDRLHGAPGSTVALTILRKGATAPIHVSITREVIRINPVKWHAEGDVGYIRISTFSGQTSSGLEQAVAALKRDIGPSLKGYVLDLRNDPGGLVDQAVTVADDLLASGSILSIKGRHPSDEEHMTATPGDIADGKPIVVLINAGTASASEIVTGALKDDKRATVVGTRSFGKGTVQTILPLGDGKGALRLTTSRYYTPSGKSIQAKGIEPDAVVEEELPNDPAVQEQAAHTPSERSLTNHLATADHDDDDDDGAPAAGTGDERSVAYVPEDTKADTQLQYALQLLRSPPAPGQPLPPVAAHAQVSTAKKLPPQ